MIVQPKIMSISLLREYGYRQLMVIPNEKEQSDWLIQGPSRVAKAGSYSSPWTRVSVSCTP
jgi:hypothetical protein